MSLRWRTIGTICCLLSYGLAIPLPDEEKPAEGDVAKPVKDEEATKPAEGDVAKPVNDEEATKPAEGDVAKPVNDEEATQPAEGGAEAKPAEGGAEAKPAEGDAPPEGGETTPAAAVDGNATTPAAEGDSNNTASLITLTIVPGAPIPENVCECITRGPLPRFKLIGNIHFPKIKVTPERYVTMPTDPVSTLCPPCICPTCPSGNDIDFK